MQIKADQEGALRGIEERRVASEKARRASGIGIDIGAGYSMFPLNRLDPTARVKELRNAPPERPAPAPLAVALLETDAPWTSLEIEGAEKFPGLAPAAEGK